MKQIIDYLKKKHTFDKLIDDKKVIYCNNDDSFAFLINYQFNNLKETTIIVTDNLLSCQNLYNILASMLKEEVYMYCVDEIVKFTSLASSPEMQTSRLYVLNKLIEDKPIIVVTHSLALKRICPSKQTFKNSCIELSLENECGISILIERLTKLGYKNVFKVTQPFEFSTRGGVLDVFSLNYDNPIRIEFFDTIIDSIRFFDVESQRTIITTKNIKIIPANEFLVEDIDSIIPEIEKFASKQYPKTANNLILKSNVNEDLEHLKLYDFQEYLYKYYMFSNNHSSLADYIFDKRIYLVDEDKIKNNELFFDNEIHEELLDNFEQGNTLYNLVPFISYKDVKNELLNVFNISTAIENNIVDLNFVKVETFDFSLDLFYKQLIDLLTNHYTIYIGLDSQIHYNLLKDYFDQKNVSYNEIDEDDKLKEGINLSHEDLNIGLELAKEKLYIVGEKELFKKRFKPAISQFNKYKDAITLDSVNELEIGDYLVHEYHGIGIYQGLETLINNGVHSDYLVIKYKNDDILYLPLEQFKLVRKYVSKEGAVPRLSRLGSKEWLKTKEKINARVNEIAEKLVKLYSSRVSKEGFGFVKDDEFQESFENDFGFELTRDQKTCLAEVKKDMESPYIMDRLLVGDVGFGKTEIAFRAAFKAINSGKQVAFLCPTTLLARQHYLTAIDRFRNFGVNIRLLSRLVSDREVTNTLKGLKDKTVDLVIGTHRLLSDDVSFNDLGLLIVDEEHKFGVEHKEKIKELKENVDVLTLSATPIPRTLQMALTGIRGFSTINTPIDNRMPVQTYVIKKDYQAVKEIIERELARNGQVYYLCNNISRLPSIANEIQKRVKNAKIAIGHGKLSVEQVEDLMQRFINNEFNVLLCTTIIENGIDIPNVNTIIVENADTFGLSQLYQIKGRVGRSDRLAYCYLMFNPTKQLSEIATKRLKTIKEFTALGSGYKIAMRDLITRGAGDMLGPEQSGFIETIGIDMYIEMLHDAINKQKDLASGIEIQEKSKATTTKNQTFFQVDAYIPENYFTNDYEKIELYKRIDKVKNIDELSKLKEEIIDETGKLPSSINMLFEKRYIELFEKQGLIDNFAEFDNYVLIKLSKDIMKYRSIGVSLFDMASSINRAISLKFNYDHIDCHIQKVDGWIYLASRFINGLAKLVESYK